MESFSPLFLLICKYCESKNYGGKFNQITVDDGKKLTGRYILVDSGAVTPSHDALHGFCKYPGFPTDPKGNSLTERDYERDSFAQDYIRQIAFNYDSRALLSPVVVSVEGLVLSGNARTMAGELAARDNTDGLYIDYLKNYCSQYGFTSDQINGFEHPRVIFQLIDEIPYSARTFAMFNRENNNKLNSRELINFVAIDLETATSVRSSICQIGITEVVNGVPQKPLSWFVRPENNEYDYMNISIHGIRPEDTKNSPSFPEVWKEVQPYLQDKIVVAHNTSFDMYALRDAFIKYEMEFPTFDYFCTLRIAKYIIKGCYSYSLDVVLNHIGLDLDVHHKADSDSLGCAKLLLKCFEIDGSSFDTLESKYNFHRGKFTPGAFVAQLTKNKSHGKSSYVDYINSLQLFPESFDEGNYFFGKSVCFTGTCQYGTRKELLLKVAQVGGIPTDSVTTKTNVLVVGQQDYKIVGESGMSSKQKKAMQLLEKGQDIEILSESEFLSRI